MVKSFSAWLSSHEYAVRLGFRLVVLCILGFVLAFLGRIESDLAAVDERVSMLQNDIDEIRADLQNDSNDTTPTGAGSTQNLRL